MHRRNTSRLPLIITSIRAECFPLVETRESSGYEVEANRQLNTIATNLPRGGLEVVGGGPIQGMYPEVEKRE
jgi:hypothetical protein